MKKIVLYGIGKSMQDVIPIGIFNKANYLVDSDINKLGTYLGKKVYAPQHLLTEDKDNLLIIVTGVNYYAEISQYLDTMGFIENYNYVDPLNLNEDFYEKQSRSAWEHLSEEEEQETFKSYEALWMKRAKLMLSLLPEDFKTICDLGCGDMKLKKLIAKDINYIGVDRIKRDENTMICDFNKGEFPHVETDIYFMSGCLEYICDPQVFIENFKNKNAVIIFSYHPLEYYNNFISMRPAIWKNQLKITELILLFQKNGYVLTEAINTLPQEIAFRFDNIR